MTGLPVDSVREQRLLGFGLALLVGTFLLHGIVHAIRRVTPLPTVLAGWALLVAAVGVLIAVWRGHRAARASLVVSVLAGGGLCTVHLLPIWGPLSEPWRSGIHTVWWFSLYLALFGAVWAASVACYAIRCERTLQKLKWEADMARYLHSNWFARKIINPIAMRTRLATTLLVRARSTGRAQAIPVNVLDYGGAEYLVSVRGESQWVRNLRAAGTCDLRRNGSLREVGAEELPVEARGPIIDAYRKRWGYQVGPYFKRLPDPADHPVFRLFAV